MKALIKTSSIIIIAVTVGFVSTSAFAQSANGPGQGGQGSQGGGGRGEASSPGAESDHNNAFRILARKPGTSSSPNNPNSRIPRKPKIEEVAFKPISQRDPCLAVHQMITKQNMLVMVPRYNDCVRRNGNNR